MYLNSDLRSDTGLKLAKEVSRCLCIQDTAPPWILRTPFVPKEGTMRATARPAFHRNHHCPSGGGGSVEKLFSPARKLELLRIFIPIFSSPFFVCIYIYICISSVELIRRNGPIMGSSRPFFTAYLYHS